MDFWDFFWLLVWSFFFVMYLMVLFQIIADLFRDPEVGGGGKALWLIGLILVPFLVALIYLIVRGRGMAERHLAAAQKAQADTDQYIKSVASGPSSADQIASAKALLDSGAINQSEFEQLKARALA
jgi:Short C-terminal domain/Phospholipase_D-nuclease N-terminal